MTRRRKWMVLVACGILALAVLWQLLRDREPSYQGRKLSEWVSLANQSVWTSSGWRVPDAKLSEINQAQGAIHAIGTNALPHALKWISYDPAPVRQRIAALAKKRFSPRISRYFTNPEHRAAQAVAVFEILGPEARPAIPALARLALTASDRNRACRCIDSLRHIGPEALPAVLALATNGPPDASHYVFVMLPGFGTNAAAAVAFLIQCLDDKDKRIAAAAEDTLCKLDRSAVFSSLTNALHSPSAQVRGHVVSCFQWMGTSVSEAVPVLEPLLSDPDYHVRRATTNALYRRFTLPERVRYQVR